MWIVWFFRNFHNLLSLPRSNIVVFDLSWWGSYAKDILIIFVERYRCHDFTQFGDLRRCFINYGCELLRVFEGPKIASKFVSWKQLALIVKSNWMDVKLVHVRNLHYLLQPRLDFSIFAEFSIWIDCLFLKTFNVLVVRSHYCPFLDKINHSHLGRNFILFDSV